MIKKISDKDQKDWINFLNSDEKLKSKDLDIKKNTTPINKTIDLHGFTLEDANKKIEKLIIDAHEKGVSKVIVITGKGIHSNTKNNIYISEDLSKLRFSVPEFIKSDIEISKFISSISSANKNDGGEGAIVVKLKKL